MRRSIFKERVPETIFTTTTPRRPDFMAEQETDELIRLITKVRALEDELMTEKFRSQSYHKQFLGLQRELENLEYEKEMDKQEISRAKEEIYLANVKNHEIYMYEDNLRSIGEEITALNEVLQIKNTEHDALLSQNRSYEQVCQKLRQQITHYNLTHNIYLKQVQQLVQRFCGKQTKQSQSQQKSSDNILNNLSRLTKQFQVTQMVLRSRHEHMEKAKKEASEALAVERELRIKFQYQLKLVQERQNDDSRHEEIIEMANEGKMEMLIEEMLKKEDEYLAKVTSLHEDIEELKKHHQNSMETESNIHRIELMDKNDIIQTLQKEIIILNNTIEGLSTNNVDLQIKYEESLQETQRGNEEDISMMKKLRNMQESQQLLSLQLEQLKSENQMLHRELEIFKE